jgi:tetratricopeptide (TPR) repeat protein
MRSSLRPKKSTNVRVFLIVGFLAARSAAAAFAAEPQTPSTPLGDVAVTAADAALRRGAELFEKARWDEARRAFEGAIMWNPDLTMAHYNLGVTLGLLGRSDEAIAAYRAALRLAPRMAAALVNLGVELSKRDRLHEALDSLEKAARVAPGYAPAQHNLGVVLASLGRLDEAIAALDRAAALVPEDPATRRALADTHYNIGVRHAGQRQWMAALTSYETAVRFSRELPDAFNGAGVALSRLGRERDSLPMFEEAVRQRPSYAEARYNLARSLAVLGRYFEAMAECRTVLSAQPHLRQAIELLDSLERIYARPSRRLGARALPRAAPSSLRSDLELETR